MIGYARTRRTLAALAAASLCLPAVARAQRASLRPAAEVRMPATADSNSPAHWDGDRIYVFNSWNHPVRSHGADQFTLAAHEPVRFLPDDPTIGNRWIEATWPGEDGWLYGWYHNEPPGLCPGSEARTKYGLTAPRIGAVRSRDNGGTWEDLGFILTARPDSLDCSARNGYFAGGHGDFSVVLDAAREYLYILFGSYAGPPAEQGVAIARMAWSDRAAPAGRVLKWHRGGWSAPGIGGRLTPIFRVATSWRAGNTDALWGPSVHWNTHLERYVMLLNRACCEPEWPQAGVYVSYSTAIRNPGDWSSPVPVLAGGEWYPQVIGLDAARRETDKRAGRVARFYMRGVSRHEIVFER